MTATFEAIRTQKLGAMLKVMEGLQDLCGQPHLDFPPDQDLRKCSSAELVYLIALNEQAKLLEIHAKAVLTTLHQSNNRVQTTGEVLRELDKLGGSTGGFW